LYHRILGTAALVVALTACASSEPTPTVRADVSSSANFAAYRTYSWISSSVPAGIDPLIGDRIRDRVDAAMASKGYTKVDAPKGDLSLGFTVATKDKPEIATYDYYSGYQDIRNYTEGHLTVEAFDTSTRRAVWHGSATQRINPNGDPSHVNGVVDQVMQSFPSNAPAAPAG
jgi:hypothetical protein